MLFQKQNFVHNFSGANDAQDVSLLFDIFSSEISDLLCNSIESVFELFSSTGVYYTKANVPFSVYVDTIIKQLQEGNQSFFQGLAFLMGQANSSFEQEWDSQLGTISDGIVTIADDLNSNPTDINLLKSQILNGITLRVSKSNITRAVDFKTNYFITTAYVVLVLGIGLMLVRLYFPKKASVLGIQSQPLGIFDSKPNDGMTVTPDVLVPNETAAIETAQVKQTPEPSQQTSTQATTQSNPAPAAAHPAIEPQKIESQPA